VIGQYAYQYLAWDGTYSIQIVYEQPVTGYFEITLNNRVDHNDFAVPVSEAFAVLTELKGTGGNIQVPSLWGVSWATNLTELNGLLIASNCHAAAVVNAFIWA
jgi:hypothetical protein